MYFDEGRVTNRHIINKIIEVRSLKVLTAMNADRYQMTPHHSMAAMCKVSPPFYFRSLCEDSLLDGVQRK